TLALLALGAAGLFMGQIRMGGGSGGISAPALTANPISGEKIVVPLPVMDKDGNVKTMDAISLSLDAGKPRIALSDKNGAPRLELKLDADGNPGLRMLDAKSNELATLATDAKGVTHLVIKDAAGKQLFAAPAQ